MVQILTLASFFSRNIGLYIKRINTNFGRKKNYGFMTAKFECLERIRSLMNERGIQHIFLDNYIHCPKWPGRDNPYQILEILLRNDDRIEVWQGPGYNQQNTSVYLDEFDIQYISLVEKEIINTFSKLKKYRVQIISYVDVLASSPIRAEELASCCRFNAKEKMLWIELGNKTQELK